MLFKEDNCDYLQLLITRISLQEKKPTARRLGLLPVQNRGCAKRITGRPYSAHVRGWPPSFPPPAPSLWRGTYALAVREIMLHELQLRHFVVDTNLAIYRVIPPLARGLRPAGSRAEAPP
ncbi:hypothetical protein EVAR_90518_1 [Eumeta japonica]|uniref:Uncharacterized protein n=1 Tax=Eumeta variegata TaxID=151549 RepID=A0A4C1XVS3_EUMVA|nr:hypothetical protein EVAR_90518_1 [Eumeta japonica]